MTNRLYFFREEDDYEVQEMRQRLKVGDFKDIQSPPVQNILSESSVTGQDLTKKESELHETLRTKLGPGRYRLFVKDVFEHCGEKGDRFNLQLFFASGLDASKLLGKVEEKKRSKSPDELSGEPLAQSLTNYKQVREGVIDLRFSKTEVYTYDLSDVEDQEEDVITDSGYSFIEARVYTDCGVVAISHRQLDDEEISRVRRAIESWADGVISPSTDLMENELLAIQNSLNGDNCGIDYGDFREDEISTAKYRGQRNLALSRSRIVQPASQDGRIISLRFYYTYGSGNHERDVLIRVHRDGHLTSSKETEPDLIDKIAAIYARIHKHKDYWKTLNSEIEEYISELMIRDIIKGVKNYKSKKHQATGANITEFVDPDDYQAVEVQVYEAVLFNIAQELIAMNHSGNLSSTGFTSGEPEERGELKGLFDDYAEYVLEDPNYDFDLVWEHLDSLLSSEYSSPVELIENATDMYDI